MKYRVVGEHQEVVTEIRVSTYGNGNSASVKVVSGSQWAAITFTPMQEVVLSRKAFERVGLRIRIEEDN